MHKRIQLVSLPHTQTNQNYSTCAYTQKVRKFADMMSGLGHSVLLYGSDNNTAEVTENIVCITTAQQKSFGFSGPEDYLNVAFNPALAYWQLFNNTVIEEMKDRIETGDIICVITGYPADNIRQAFPNNLFVEFGIGYEGIIPQAHHVFESYAWRDYVYGKTEVSDGKFYDEVIPNYFEIEDFPFVQEPDKYFLYIGRLTDRKGWRIAQQVCEEIGAKLKVAGPGEFSGYGDYVGVVGAEERGKLMSEAAAVFVPTLYIPPFEGVHIEANLCGTPVITTDFGVFSETVENGSNGYRCKTLQEFVDVTRSIQMRPFSAEERQSIRRSAQAKYGTAVVAKQYDKYFDRLLGLYSGGWGQVV